MALGSCGHRITHQLRPINMNGRSILSVTSDLHNYFLSVIIDSHAPGIGGRGRDEGDIVQEGGRHAAISKALNNRNAAGPRGLKPAASFQGLSPIGSGRGAVDHPGVVHPVLPPAVGSGNGRVSQVPGGTLMIIRHTPPTPA
jgi:hypothetical protein